VPLFEIRNNCCTIALTNILYLRRSSFFFFLSTSIENEEIHHMVNIITSFVSFPMASCAVPPETATELFVHYNVLFMLHPKISVTITEFWKKK